jgi:hypothetical protein
LSDTLSVQSGSVFLPQLAFSFGRHCSRYSPLVVNAALRISPSMTVHFQVEVAYPGILSPQLSQALRGSRLSRGKN